MTLQFRSRITSAIDYTKELTAYGVCCEHDMSPTSPTDPTPKNRFNSYTSTANKCYSDQNSESYITRTFYPNVDIGQINCASAADLGCCCSCGYAKQSSPTDYSEFLKDPNLLPFDLVVGEDKKCDINEYDIEIALHPEVGMRNGVAQCECARIGGVWKKGKCPIVESETEAPDVLFDQYVPYYHWYWDESLSDWVSRPTTGDNSKTQLIKTHCYKKDALTSTGSIDEPPPAQKGTCCISPIVYGDWKYCHGTAVTQIECQQLADPNSDVGSAYPGRNGDFEWNVAKDPEGQLIDCSTCLSEPITGVCCPNSDNEFYGNPFKCSIGIEASLYDSQFGSTSDHPCANLPGFDSTTGKGYDYKENETSCATCPKKGLCCNDNLGVCLGLTFKNQCISSGSGFRWVELDTEQAYSDECGDNVCNFPKGRCCVIESDRSSSCYDDVTEYQCEVEGIDGGPTGTWTQGQVCGSDPDVTCGVGLCCDYANNICSGGKTIETCSGPDKVLHVNKTGAECEEVCHFNKGWCCSVDQYDTDDDGSKDVICHGFVTKTTCNNIRDTNRFESTIFNNRDDLDQGCDGGCPGFTNSLSICCEDANTPPDGYYETCIEATNPGDFVTELECLFTKSLDANGDYTFTPRTNRKWYDNADTCYVCVTQTLGSCCNYTNNKCSTTTEATCTDPEFGGNANNEWGIAGGCTNCNFEGLCCYVEVGSDGSLIPKCEDDVKKFTCINEKRGIWNIDGTCETNGCGWGVCCNMSGVANAPSCQLARNGKLAGYDPIDFSELSCPSGNFRPFTPEEISQAGNWSTQFGFTDPDISGPAEKICSNVDVFDPDFNWFTTPIPNNTLFECRACNRLCDYKGSFCKDLDCGAGGVPCGPLSPGCQCSYGTYDVYETVSNSRCGNTWKNGVASCDTCNTNPPSWSMQASYDGGDGALQEGESVTVKLTGTGLNPTLGAFGITYAISGNISAADFSPLTPPNNGTFNFGSDGSVRSSQFSLTTIADFTTEGNETFYVKTTSPTLSLPIEIKDTSVNADYKLVILDSQNNETTDFSLDERIDTFRKIKFTFGTNPPPSGSTYSWAITGSNITTGDFLSLGALTGVFTLSDSNSYADSIDLTVNKDKVTEGQEDFTFSVTKTNPPYNIAQTFNIEDTAPAPTYLLTRDTTFITEGLNDSITFTFKVFNEDPGTTYTWAISGTSISAADLNLTSLSGAFTLSSGNYAEWTESVGFTGATGDAVEGTESFTFTVSRLGVPVPGAQISGNEIRETSNLSLDFIGNDNYYEAVSLSSAGEGSFIRARLKTLNVPAGTTFAFKLYGPGITQSDLTGLPAGSVTWDGSGFTGIFEIRNTNIVGGVALPAGTGYDVQEFQLYRDYITDGGETFQVYLLTNPNLTTYSPTTGVTSTNLTVLDYYKDPKIQYSFKPSTTTTPDNSRALVEEISPLYSSYPSGFTLIMNVTNWTESGKNLIANITSWNGSNVTPNDFGGVWRTATSSSSTIGTNTEYLGLFDQIYGNTLLGIPLKGPTGIYISAAATSSAAASGIEGLTGLVQYFFQIRKDATTDIDPCGANPFEGFTFSVPSGQTLARPYSGPATLTGVTSNFIIYETSSSPTTGNFIVYENNEILTGTNPTVTENDTLKFVYEARNLCNASLLAVQINGAGGSIDYNDIDFDNSSISETQFNGCFNFNILGTFALGTASNPLTLKFNQDDEEGIENLTIKVYRKPCASYLIPGPGDGSYAYNQTDLLSTINIGIGDGAPAEPRGHCCNPLTGCRGCPGGCLDDDCAPTETFTTAWFNWIGNSCPTDFGGVKNCNNPPYEEQCSACCGKKRIWCCNPSTGVATNECVAAPFSCPAGQSEVPQESDCVKKVTCCNDFNNTCTIAYEDPGCLGAFERTEPYSIGCSVCNFDTEDPECNLGVKFDYNVSWPVPINNNLAYNNSAFASGQYPGSTINEDFIFTSPVNMMEYLCSTAVCCGGDGEACVKNVYNWSTTGAKTSSGCGGQPDYNQNPLWGEQTQFYSACTHAAKNNWTPTTDLVGQSTTPEQFYQKYIYNALNPNWTPHKCSNCSYGVCCKLDKNNGTTECLGSRVSREWCYAKELANTDSSKVIRWISSYHQCKDIDIVSSDRQSITGSLTIPPYDCEICKEIVDLNYLYPGAWNQRDFWPGTLPKNTHVTACVNCKPEGDPSGGGHDPLYERFQDYFNMNISDTIAQPFMKYQSLPDNFSSAKYTLDQNSTAESCCKSYRESPKNVQSISSNFVISRNTQVQTTDCICTDPDCICNFTDIDKCPYDYDLCCDGCKGDPFGRCCNPTNGTCTEVTRGDCDRQGGIGWEAYKPCDSTSCERGACCQYLSAGGLEDLGDSDTSTGCTEVARFECESPNQFSRGRSCPDACDGSPRPLGACCRYGVCSATTEEDCFLISPEKGGQYITWSNRPCDATICEGTRPVACCKIDEPCSVRSRQSCIDYGGTVINEEGSCDGVECEVTPTWFCDGNGVCDLLAQNGGYPSQSVCQETCKTWQCVTPGQPCQQRIGPGAPSAAACAANCTVPASWNCLGTAGCVDPGTGNGQYTNFSTCQTNCSTGFNCNSSGNCVGGQYKGQYATQQQCESNCSPPVLDTPGACCTFVNGISTCVPFSGTSAPKGTNEFACTLNNGVFFANKTCSEINCNEDVCCCGQSFDGNKCFVCTQPVGWKGAKCANSSGPCYDDFFNPTTPTSREECEGLP